MKTYEVRFTVNGKSGGSVTVQANSSIQARRLAMGEIQGRPGCSDKKITIGAAHEIK